MRRNVIANATGANRFVVKNTFKVRPSHRVDFEGMWNKRKTHLHEFPGFVSFSMLKSSTSNGEYVSQTVWRTQESFSEWLNSDQFAESHDPKRLEAMAYMLESSPVVTCYHEIISVDKSQ